MQRELLRAKFGLPDVAGDVKWLTRIADLWPAVKDKPDVTTLSHHHYWGGPPSNPQANIQRLMLPDEIATMQGAVAREARRVRVPPFTYCTAPLFSICVALSSAAPLLLGGGPLTQEPS